VLLRDLGSAVERADVDYLVDEVPRVPQQSLDGVMCVSRLVGVLESFARPGDSIR